MSSINNKPDYLYRSGVGIMVINKNKEIFVAKRVGNNGKAWQMPQGGIDVGESEDLAMFRELKEETSIDNIKIISVSKKYLYYNLPYNLQKRFWGGKYLGQRQKWYLVEFLGDDKDINIETKEPEFSEWKWVKQEELIESVVAFKREIYVEIIEEFKDFFDIDTK